MCGKENLLDTFHRAWPDRGLHAAVTLGRAGDAAHRGRELVDRVPQWMVQLGQSFTPMGSAETTSWEMEVRTLPSGSVP